MAVKGVFASDMGIQSNRKGDFASGLLYVHPNGSAPMFALTSGMESQSCGDTVVTWFEENHLAGRAQVTDTGNVNGTATAVDVKDASFLVAGTILLVESTGEYIFVSAVNGATLTIERGFAGSTAAAIGNAAYLQRIGTAYEEGSSKPTSVVNLGYPVFNYVQIFRNSWDVTGTARAVEFYTGNQVAKNKADCALFHGEDIERSILWGRKSISVKNNKPFRTMDGILTMIKTNVTAAGATTSWKQLDAFLQGVFMRNIKGKPNERIAFCGNAVVTVLNEIARKNSQIMIEPGETEFGLKIMRWVTPFGSISLMTHPLMVESPLWTKDLYVLHPGATRTRYLRRTFEDNYDSEGRRAGVDADYGVLTTEMSVEYRAEITGGKLIGVTAAALDA